MYIDTKNHDLYYHIDDDRINAPLVEIDELIAPIISILNKKGYKTEYCCSGHFDRSRTYIVFAEHYVNIIVSNIPDGFELIEGLEEDHLCLGNKLYEYEEFTKERLLSITDNIIKLWNWAEELPINQKG